MTTWGNYKNRYLGDANPRRLKHVHDLTNQKPSCSLVNTEWAGNEVSFPTKEAAFTAGYAPCLFCMPYEKNAS